MTTGDGAERPSRSPRSTKPALGMTPQGWQDTILHCNGVCRQVLPRRVFFLCMGWVREVLSWLSPGLGAEVEILGRPGFQTIIQGPGH